MSSVLEQEEQFYINPDTPSFFLFLNFIVCDLRHHLKCLQLKLLLIVCLNYTVYLHDSYLLVGAVQYLNGLSWGWVVRGSIKYLLSNSSFYNFCHCYYFLRNNLIQPNSSWFKKNKSRSLVSYYENVHSQCRQLFSPRHKQAKQPLRTTKGPTQWSWFFLFVTISMSL